MLIEQIKHLKDIYLSYDHKLKYVYMNTKTFDRVMQEINDMLSTIYVTISKIWGIEIIIDNTMEDDLTRGEY